MRHEYFGLHVDETISDIWLKIPIDGIASREHGWAENCQRYFPWMELQDR